MSSAEEAAVIPPETGWWFCTRDEYDADTEYLRSSELKDFYTCPTIYKARHLDGTLPRIKHKDYFTVGSGLHSIVLEDLVTHTVKADCQADITSKSSKNFGQKCGSKAIGTYAGQWLCGVHSKDVELEIHEDAVTVEQDRAIRAMAEAIKQHVPTQELLQHRRRAERNHAELGARSVDRVTGVKKKALLDILCFNPFAIVDLKTTEEFTAEAMWRRIDSLSYWLSMAHYESVVLDIAAANGKSMPFPQWVLIFIESVPPYRIHHQPLTDIQEESRREYQELLAQFAEAQRTGVYRQRELEIGVPQWYGFKHSFDRKVDG